MNAQHKIALLAASGVSEHEMTAIQRALANAKIFARVISPESGLIHSWAEGTWGHCYPADAKLETSLGVDYDMLILPGGERHVKKLNENPHTKRFVTSFFTMKKPVVAFADAKLILEAASLAGDNAMMLDYADADALTQAADTMADHLKSAMDTDMAQAA